jgi:hypothetical protein
MTKMLSITPDAHVGLAQKSVISGLWEILLMCVLIQSQGALIK